MQVVDLLLLLLGLQGPALSALMLQQFFFHVTGHVFLVIVITTGHLASIMRLKITSIISKSN